MQKKKIRSKTFVLYVIMSDLYQMDHSVCLVEIIEKFYAHDKNINYKHFKLLIK